MKPPPQHDQVLGYGTQLHDAGGVEELDLRKTWNRRDGRSAAGVDENQLRTEPTYAAIRQLDFHLAGAAKPRRPFDEIHRRVTSKSALAADAEGLDDVSLPAPNGLEIDGDLPDPHSVIGRPTGQICDARAGGHRLCRRATLDHARPADPTLLDAGDPPSRVGEGSDERLSTLPGSDDDAVEILGHRGTKEGSREVADPR